LTIAIKKKENYADSRYLTRLNGNSLPMAVEKYQPI